MRVLAATVLAFTLAICLWGLPELEIPDGLEFLALLAYILVLVAIGALGGWWAVPLTAAAFIAVTVMYQVLFWQDDPKLVGIDDIPPLAGIILIPPFILPLVAFGAVLRRRRLGRLR